MDNYRIENEKQVVSNMIKIYCKQNHKYKALCNECSELLEYAHKRLDACKFGNSKPFCSKCTVHCYNPTMRDKIKKVMRYSGPRIIFYNPVTSIKHFLQK